MISMFEGLEYLFVLRCTLYFSLEFYLAFMATCKQTKRDEFISETVWEKTALVLTKRTLFPTVLSKSGLFFCHLCSMSSAIWRPHVE